jgi:hypothetical protein
MSDNEELLKTIREQLGQVWVLLKSIEIRVEQLEENWCAAYEEKKGIKPTD